MAVNEALSSLANVVGLVVDRTVIPEIVLGQACLVSKGRSVACASSVYNYVEAPWALSVRFLHPDLEYGVKQLSLHPDFSRRDARASYLTQTGLPTDPPLCLDNDIATLTIDPVLQELEGQHVAELNGLLSLSPEVTPQEVSGPVQGDDIASIIERLATSGREGLLTLLDERKRPVARLAVRQGVQGFVQRSIFKMLTGELAVFELILRKPRGMFIFQQNAAFSWPNARDIETPLDKLLAEATRRAAEMPAFVSSLGGPKARYVKTVPQMDVNAVHPNARWIVERLWTVLDGYLTLDKIWERIGADTYTTLRAVQEMLRLRIIALEPGSAFPSSGQLGVPLAPYPPQDLKPGEPLTGFFLDPLTGRPVTIQGAFQGKATTGSNTLLHNIQFPPAVSGAIVVKNNQLIGLTSGPYIVPPGQAAPQARLYQMTPVQALSDSVKKLRNTGAFDVSAPEPPPPAAQPQEPVAQDVALPQGARIGRFICPACNALNIASGLCQRCGADLETGQMPPPAKGERSLRSLQSIDGISSKHLMMGGAAVLVLGSAAMLFMGQPKQTAPQSPTPAPAATTAQSSAGDQSKAVKIAVEQAGFKDTLPPGYTYSDPSAETNNAPSFMVGSEEKNQRILGIIMETTAPADHLELVAIKVPYTDFAANPDIQNSKEQIAAGPSNWGGVKFNYVVGRYMKPDGTQQMALVGTFLSPIKGKSVLIIARPFKDVNLDYKTTLWLIETLAEPLIAKTPKPEETAANTGDTSPQATKAGESNEVGSENKKDESTTEEKKEATSEELAAYAKKLEESLKAKFSPPKEAVKSKAKATMLVGIDEQGHVSKLELSEASGEDNYDQALSKLVQSFQYPPAPYSKSGPLILKVTADGAKLIVSQQQ